MISKFIVGCKYSHIKMRNHYFSLEAVEEFDEYVKLAVVWRDKKTDIPVAEKAHVVCVLKRTYREYYAWQR
jgi:hypothetical protein